MIRIDRLHENQPKTDIQDTLSAEAQKFIAGLDPTGLSRSFQ